MHRQSGTQWGSSSFSKSSASPLSSSWPSTSSSSSQAPPPFHPPQRHSFNEPDLNIYSEALSVSEPRFLHDDQLESHPPMIRQKVIRRVEVPFTRQVKVPSSTTHIVPTLQKIAVPVRQLVSVNVLRPSPQLHTDYELRERIRPVEQWQKRIVLEKVTERVPVTKVRRVRVPTTDYKEITEFETVAVPTTRLVSDVEAVRVDRVVDTKVVEVEEEEACEWQPVARGPSYIVKTTDLGRIPSPSRPHSLLDDYHKADDHSEGARHNDSNKWHNHTPFIHSAAVPQPLSASSASSPTQPSRRLPPSPFSAPSASSSTSSRFHPSRPPPPATTAATIEIGGVRLCSSRIGVEIEAVTPFSSAHLSGLEAGDVVVQAHHPNCPIATPQDVVRLYLKIPGPLHLQIRKTNGKIENVTWKRA